MPLSITMVIIIQYLILTIPTPDNWYQQLNSLHLILIAHILIPDTYSSQSSNLTYKTPFLMLRYLLHDCYLHWKQFWLQVLAYCLLGSLQLFKEIWICKAISVHSVAWSSWCNTDVLLFLTGERRFQQVYFDQKFTVIEWLELFEKVCVLIYL